MIQHFGCVGVEDNGRPDVCKAAEEGSCAGGWHVAVQLGCMCAGWDMVVSDDV